MVAVGWEDWATHSPCSLGTKMWSCDESENWPLPLLLLWQSQESMMTSCLQGWFHPLTVAHLGIYLSFLLLFS
ncbi:hypothetical protein X975_02311, partial [Stegodyphus mimosarum]